MEKVIITVILIFGLGCANSPIRNCWSASEGTMGKAQCGNLILPVLGPFLPNELTEPEPDESAPV